MDSTQFVAGPQDPRRRVIFAVAPLLVVWDPLVMMRGVLGARLMTRCGVG